MLRLIVLLLALLLPPGRAQADLAAIRLEDGAGAALSMADLVEEVRIVHLWATWCAPCREELPELEAFITTHGLEDELLLISVDRAPIGRVNGFLDEIGLSLQSYRVTGGNIGSAFAILAYPSTVVVDPQGEVLYRRQGPVDWPDAAQAREVLDLLPR